MRAAVAALALGFAAASPIAQKYGVSSATWSWRFKGMPELHKEGRDGEDYKVRYQSLKLDDGKKRPKAILVHGFGGNCEHWRKVMPMLAPAADCYAIDLLGFGYSEKPTPRVDTPYEPAKFYNFDNWGTQLLDFMDEVVDDDAFLITNSVGGIAAMSAALQNAQDPRRRRVRGVQLMSPSLRMLHKEKQPPISRPFTSALQWTLRETKIGNAFFGQVATMNGVRSVLKECYGDANAVTDELVEAILKPGLEPGATEVFLDFISYSSGPLPERQLAGMKGAGVPVSILWGDKDPWEPIDMGKQLLGPEAHPDVVEEFVTLPGLGHCPMDESPDMVVPRIREFVERHA